MRACALVLITLAGCGRTPSRAPRWPYERLVLEPADGPLPARERTVLASFSVGPQVPSWKVDADSARVVDLPAATGGHALEMTSAGKVAVEIPGSFDPTAFDAVSVEVQVERNEELELRFWRAGRVVQRTDSKIFDGGGVLRRVAFDVGGLEPGTPLDALSIHFRRSRGPLRLASVELASTPPEVRLPAPAAPELVTIGREARRCVGLVEGRPLACRLAARPDAELVLSYAVPAGVRNRPGAALRVSLGPANAPARVERSFPLDGDAGWREVRVPCADAGGGELRARFEVVAGAGAGEAACALGEPALARRDAAAPSVLLVTSDTHRADHLGTARASVGVRTPTLDALAARGVLFEDCVSSTNLTVPSHCALMTGTHPRDSGVIDNVTALAEEAPTLAERFREAGFRTFASVSVEYLGQGASGLGQGFERQSVPQTDFQRDSSETIADLLPWLDDAEGLPLFVWVHVFDAHDPYDPPEAYQRLYYPADRDPYDRALPAPPREALPKWDRRVRDLAYVAAQYEAEVTYLDERLAGLLEHPRLRAGVIAVTADHGEFLQGRRWFDHHAAYPPTLEIPLLLAGPGVPAGERIATPARQIDLGRTLLDLAGLADAEFPGRDLLARDAAPGEPRFALAGNGKAAGVFADGWYLVLHLSSYVADESKQPVPAHGIELYDARADPDCREDLAEREPERACTLRAALVEWLVDTHARHWGRVETIRDAHQLEELAALGYATDETTAPGDRWIDPACACEQCAPWR